MKSPTAENQKNRAEYLWKHSWIEVNMYESNKKLAEYQIKKSEWWLKYN